MEQETERQAYEVPGSQMRWRAAQLRAQGLPFETTYNNQSNTYIFFVQQPQGAQPFAYQPPPQRQAWPAVDAALVARWALVAAVVAMLLGTLYMVFARSGSDQSQQAQTEDGDLWEKLADFRLPWQEQPAQSVQAQPQAKADDGWKWPWDSAMDAAADAAESVQTTVTTVSAVVLAVLVLLIMLALVSKRRGK